MKRVHPLSLVLTVLLSGLALTASAGDAPAASKSAHDIPAIQDTETKEQRDTRMAWWREARFGMFIHWGLYSVPAGDWHGKEYGKLGEWIMRSAQIPVADYKALAPQFNPTKFNADAWVALAKNAGMKYIIITAKHHDGFAMFDSKVDPFNIVAATPFKRDPLKELAAACQKQGLKLGFYYSESQDWTAPGGATSASNGKDWDPAQNGDFAEYIEKKSLPQVEELLSHYQPFPAVIWFDTPFHMTPQLAGKFVTVLNKYPNLIWDNRLGGGYHGDYDTPEQHIPADGYPGRDWETCMTINGTWGYKSHDTNFKSTEVLLHNLIDIASKGGNYLLNVGPDATGTIPQPEVDRLNEIGKWMAVNGEAIYGTSASPLGDRHGVVDPTKKGPLNEPFTTPVWDWRCTAKPGRLYIHFMQWPGTSFQLANVKGVVSKAYLLADPQHTPLKVGQTGSDVTVTLPSTAPDPLVSVLVLETAHT